MNLFGPAIATHRGNKIVIGILTLLATGSAYLAWIKVHMPEENGTPGDYRIYIVISILLGAYAVWTSKRLVVLHAEGITYRNLLGEQQMKWDDVQKFYYSATKRSINFIPVGTYYSYKLLDAHGKKISLGTGIAQAKALGTRLIDLTQLPLLKKATEQFNNGANVDFGPIKLDRVKGITVKKWLGGRKQVPSARCMPTQFRVASFLSGAPTRNCFLHRLCLTSPMLSHYTHSWMPYSNRKLRVPRQDSTGARRSTPPRDYKDIRS